MMNPRTITAPEANDLIEALHTLKDLLAAVGVVELKISKQKKEIFFDTENAGQVSPHHLQLFCDLMEETMEDWMLEAAELKHEKGEKEE